MPKLKRVEIEKELEISAPIISKEKTEKEKLLELYQTLKDLNINSISDLENKIANAD